MEKVAFVGTYDSSPCYGVIALEASQYIHFDVVKRCILLLIRSLVRFRMKNKKNKVEKKRERT